MSRWAQKPGSESWPSADQRPLPISVSPKDDAVIAFDFAGKTPGAFAVINHEIDASFWPDTRLAQKTAETATAPASWRKHSFVAECRSNRRFLKVIFLVIDAIGAVHGQDERNICAVARSQRRGHEQK